MFLLASYSATTRLFYFSGKCAAMVKAFPLFGAISVTAKSVPTTAADNNNNNHHHHQYKKASLYSSSTTTILPSGTLLSDENQADEQSNRQYHHQSCFRRNHKTDSTLSSSLITLDPLIVCGPSGVGKGTIIELYMKLCSDNNNNNNNSNTKLFLPSFAFAVSHTTRKPRPGEINGIHYHFVQSIEQMKTMIEQNQFIEYAQVHGNYYGTSWQTLLDAQNTSTSINKNQRALLDIDVQGVRRIKEIVHNQQQQQQRQEQQQQEGMVLPNFILRPKYIFIAPPSPEILYERLVNRGTETIEAITKRTANAKAEIDYGTTPGNFDYVIVNDNIQQTVIDFTKAIQALYSENQ